MAQGTPEGATAGGNSKEEPVSMWTMETGAPINGMEMASDGSSIAIFTHDNRVALISQEGDVRWDREFDRPIVGIDLSSMGNMVVVGLRTGEIYCLDEDGEEIWSYNIHARLEDIHISKSGKFIVVGSRDTYTYFFDATGLLLWRSKADTRIREVATSTSANYVVSASSSKDIFLHDNYSSNMKGSVGWRHTLGGDITTLAISSDGHYIAAGATDNMFYYFDKLGKLHWKHNVENKINAIALAPRGDFIAVGVEGGTYPGQVCLYNAKQGLLWRYLTGSEGVRDVALTTNGRYIVAGTGDGVISLFHQKEKLLWKRNLGGPINRVAISARGRFIAAATDAGHLQLFGTIEFLINRASASHGLDESHDLVFAKPQRVVKAKPAVSAEAASGSGGLEMGRTVVTQKPAVGVVSRAKRHAAAQFAIPRWGLVVIIGLMMTLVTGFSFMPVDDPLVRPETAFLFVILLAMIMLVTLITKE